MSLPYDVSRLPPDSRNKQSASPEPNCKKLSANGKLIAVVPITWSEAAVEDFVCHQANIAIADILEVIVVKNSFIEGF